MLRTLRGNKIHNTLADTHIKNLIEFSLSRWKRKNVGREWEISLWLQWPCLGLFRAFFGRQ